MEVFRYHLYISIFSILLTASISQTTRKHSTQKPVVYSDRGVEEVTKARETSSNNVSSIHTALDTISVPYTLDDNDFNHSMATPESKDLDTGTSAVQRDPKKPSTTPMASFTSEKPREEGSISKDLLHRESGNITQNDTSPLKSVITQVQSSEIKESGTSTSAWSLGNELKPLPSERWFPTLSRPSTIRQRTKSADDLRITTPTPSQQSSQPAQVAMTTSGETPSLKPTPEEATSPETLAVEEATESIPGKVKLEEVVTQRQETSSMGVARITALTRGENTPPMTHEEPTLSVTAKYIPQTGKWTKPTLGSLSGSKFTSESGLMKTEQPTGSTTSNPTSNPLPREGYEVTSVRGTTILDGGMKQTSSSKITPQTKNLTFPESSTITEISHAQSLILYLFVPVFLVSLMFTGQWIWKNKQRRSESWLGGSTLEGRYELITWL